MTLDKTKDSKIDSTPIKIIEDASEDKYRLYSSLSFMIVVVLIGVPMWWKTTEVYRVNLPYSSIKNLNDNLIEIKFQIYLYGNKSTELIQKLKLELNEEDNDYKFFNIEYIEIPALSEENILHCNTPGMLESYILKRIKLKAGNFLLIEWPKLEEELFLTSDRTGFYSKNIQIDTIKNVLDLIMLKKYQINSILKEEPMNRFRSSSSQLQLNYDVLVSVINPRPDQLNVKWNVHKASEIYMKPFLEKINQISNYTLKTQWKFQIPFEFPLKQVKDSSPLGRHYELSELDLPHMLTSIEKNLGIGISENPILNIVFYVPPCDVAPLFIYKRNGQRASTQENNGIESFASTKWGGIIIYNPPIDVCLKYQRNLDAVEFHINSNDAMQTALYHILKYFDIQTDINLQNVKLNPIENLSPRNWELDSYLRRNIINYIYTSTRTLQSLIQLLDDISYIVINDNVGAAINRAYDMILKAKESLKLGDLDSAAIYAKEAFASSEYAFFDATLLAQLYFPDEQKYAIYIPLFLPIMVPVITSLSSMLKLYENRHKNLKNKIE